MHPYHLVLNRKLHKPKWYNNLIDAARRERRRAERKRRKTRSDSDRLAFNEAKQAVSSTFTSVKSKLYRDSLANAIKP